MINNNNIRNILRFLKLLVDRKISKIILCEYEETLVSVLEFQLCTCKIYEANITNNLVFLCIIINKYKLKSISNAAKC